MKEENSELGKTLILGKPRRAGATHNWMMQSIKSVEEQFRKGGHDKNMAAMMAMQLLKKNFEDEQSDVKYERRKLKINNDGA